MPRHDRRRRSRSQLSDCGARGHGDRNRMIAIVGAGPAGMAAARRARECGADVTVIDDNTAPGGQIWRGEGRALPAGVRFLSSTRVIGGDRTRQVLLAEGPEGAREIGYDRLILATGARELFLPFPGWTLPGVFGAGGLQALAKSGLSLRRKRIAVGGSGPLLLAAAEYFRKCGAQVVLIAEQASTAQVMRFATEVFRDAAKLTQAVRLQTALLGVPWRHGCWMEAAEGSGRVERVRVRQGRRTWTEEVDYAAAAWGLVANTELEELFGCESLANTGGVEVSTIEGEIAGLEAGGRPDLARELQPRLEKARRFAQALDRAFALRPEVKALARPETLVCRCEDVPLARLLECRSFREAKLHTRCGMGTCQGRICGAAAKELFGWRDASVRPPVLPVSVGTLAGAG
ncbi:MAG: NAD(P)/FAD-dependent oxidoreductase [Acidobacteriota bacterium]|nr:NAD(P)/FAD-dependent oxidoreductase [Acidobacteriota bacterium]